MAGVAVTRCSASAHSPVSQSGAINQEVPTLLSICVQKLAQNLIKYGPKKVKFRRLSLLPRKALEALLEILVARNALNDNVLPHALTRQTQKLGLEGASQLRRCVLNTIGRSCPNLRVLDVRSCQQVDNRIVRDVLQHCEHLEVLKVDGCTRISDSAFAPALWKPPLAGLLGLLELSVGKCTQITAEGLMGYVMKGAPYLRTLNLACCRLAITDDVASELVFSLGLESLDLSFCTQITDEAFQGHRQSLLKELHIPNMQVSDLAIERVAATAQHLQVFDAGWVMKLSDKGVVAIVKACRRLRTLCIGNTQVTDVAFEAIANECSCLEYLDASWCLRATPRALSILGASTASPRPPLRELVFDHLGALDLGQAPPPASPILGFFQNASPIPKHKKPIRFPPEPPSLFLPPTAVPISLALPPASAVAMPPHTCSPYELGSPSCSLDTALQSTAGSLDRFTLPASSHGEDNASSPGSPCTVVGCGPCFLQSSLPSSPALEPAAPPSQDVDEIGIDSLSTQSVTPATSPLLPLIACFGASLEQLFLEGVRDTVNVGALEAIAAGCRSLRQLSLTLPSGPVAEGAVSGARGGGAGRQCLDADIALETALRGVGTRCVNLYELRLDSSLRPHRPAVDALAVPAFSSLKSLTLLCATKGGGLLDSEMESILVGRTTLETLAIRNCENLSDGLFPRWCNRGERHDEAAQVGVQLDEVLLSLGLGGPAAIPPPNCAAAAPKQKDAAAATRPSRRRQQPRCPAAQTLRSMKELSLGGATNLTDRAADALAELLHDAQVVDLRGCPLLSEDAVRSFRKGCRFLRSVCVVTRDRTLSWTASASGAVKQHRHRKSSFYTSGSSGTESN